MITPDDELDFEHDVKHPNGLNSTENKLYGAMKSIGLKPKPQYKISRLTVDFAFLEQRLVIEINGPYHDTPEQKLRDSKRWFVLQKEGWERKTFDSDRVYNDPSGVARAIKNLLKMHYNLDIGFSSPLEEIETAIDVVKRENNERCAAESSQEEKRGDVIMKNMWGRICKKK